MKKLRWLAPVLALLLALSPLSALAEPIVCACGLGDGCVCFLQYGDEGNAVKAVNAALLERGYLGKDAVAGVYSQDTVRAVRAFQHDCGLPETGTLDDETLTLLLFDLTVEEMDRAYPEISAALVWIPTEGGKKRHRKPTCCKMHNPRMVSVRNAEALGMDPCGRCNPE